jgi:hypothetical protein
MGEMMGLSDRDYLRERRDGDTNVHQFRPAPKQASILSIVLTMVAVLFLLYKAALWWQDNQLKQKMAVTPLAVTPSDNRPKAEPARTFTAKAPKAAPAQPNQPAAPGTVNKCVLNGKVTYSDSACPQQATVGSVKLPPSVPMDGAQLPKTVLLAPSISQQTEAVAPPEPTLHSPVQAAPPKAAECKYLDERVRQIDKWALEPQSLQQQDVLRADRKKARDRQFFLGC